MKNKIQILILAIMLLFTSNSLQSADSLWTKVSSFSSTLTLNDIYFINKDVGFIASQVGKIFKTIDGGENWKVIQTSTTKDLNSIEFADSTFNNSNNNIGYAVGLTGTILKSIDQGETWVVQKSDNTYALENVCLFSHEIVIAVGNAGTIIKTTNQGNSWDTLYSGVKIYLNNITHQSNYSWIVGNTGVILYSDSFSNKWIQQKSNVTNDLFGVHFATKLKGWACGYDGVILHTSDGGGNWNKQESGTKSMLLNIKFIDTLNGWAFSRNGLIINTIDGGLTWNQQVSGTTKSITSSHFFDKYNGFAVGFNGTLLKYKATPSSIEAEQTTNTNLTQSTQIELFDILGRSIAIFQSYEELKANIDSYTPPHLVKWRDSGGIYHFEKMK